MRRNVKVTLRISLALILWTSVVTGGAERIEPLESKPSPLPEGTLLKAVDGSVVPLDSNDLWCFEVGRDVNETDPRISRGTRLTLLPSATLEHLVRDVNDRHLPQYRLTAQVTQYRGANFLWPIYYVPLSRAKDANEPASITSPTGEPDANGVGAGNEMPIPEEIAQRLRSRRTARAPQRPVSATGRADEAPKRAQTRVLVDIVGFLELDPGRPVFVPDALGQNVAEARYELLPCRTLERAEQRPAASDEPMRLKVAGLVTEYKGTRYLLLQRVIRVYNYGNFGG